MGRIKSTDSLYDVITSALNNAVRPMTCADLMDIHEVRIAAIERFDKDVQVTTNRVSDRLNFMWRRGVLDRFSAPPDSLSMARFAYAIKGKMKDEEPITSDLPKLGKHALSITERDGEVVLDFQQFTVIVRPK